MNIEIKNFGPIEYLKIDLDKDLHLIYGKNAIGKSYAIYCIYCLLKNLKDKAIDRRYLYLRDRNDKIKELSNKLENFANNKQSKEKNKDITKIYIDFIKEDFRHKVLTDFQNSLLNTFSSLDNLKNRYSKRNFEIVINLSKSSPIQKIRIFKDSNSNLDVKIDHDFAGIELIEKTTKTTKYSVYSGGKKIIGKPTQDERDIAIWDDLSSLTDHIYEEISTNLKDIYFLPASRSGLYQGLNSLAPILAELTQARYYIRKKIELPTLSEPVSDYFIDLSTIDRKYQNKKFNHLIRSLETKVLGGQVEFDSESKNIIYEPNGLNLKLNLSEASSMVAEMSPLVLYLKHIINHKFQANTQRFPLGIPRRVKENVFDILFIEEPEAHLHPEVQVELMKIFAEFINHNLKVFITSHSNYMFQELNNLILNKTIDADKIAVYHLVQTGDGSTQNAEMTVTEEGIDDENFQQTSIKLYEERMRILEETND